MTAILLAIHILITLTLIATVLLQRSEGGALGIGGGGGGVMSGRAAGNILTKATAGLAAAFMVTSILLAILAGGRGETESILDRPIPSQPIEAPAQPAEPAAPSAPIAD